MATKITDPRTDRQVRRLEAIPLENLEAIARANKLLVCNGKLVRPEDYPCACLSSQGARACWEQRMERRERIFEHLPAPDLNSPPYASYTCKCPCHAYDGGAA